MKTIQKIETPEELFEIITKEDVVLKIRVLGNNSYWSFELSGNPTYSLDDLSTKDMMKLIELAFHNLNAVVQLS